MRDSKKETAPASRARIPALAWLVLAVAFLAGAISYVGSGAIGDGASDGLPLKMHAQPKPVPGLAVVDGNGRTFQLQDLRGKFVLLNLWATWCPPCLQEMPSLDRLQAGLGGGDFEVVALSVDTGADSMQKIQAFYTRTGILHLKVYRDVDGAAIFQLKAVGVPTTLLLDRQGNEIGRMSGTAEWDSPEIVAALRKQLVARN